MELLLHENLWLFKVNTQNLHSNMELLLLNLTMYLNLSSTLFTFQYGATSTGTLNDIEVMKLTFTFQYGATSTIMS